MKFHRGRQYEKKIQTPDDWHGTTNGRCDCYVHLKKSFRHRDLPEPLGKYVVWNTFSGNDDYALTSTYYFDSRRNASQVYNRIVKLMKHLHFITQQELIDFGFKEE